MFDNDGKKPSEDSYDLASLAERVAEAEQRRRLAEQELATLRSLRSVRVGIAFSESASKGSLWRLPGRVRAALQPTPLPASPDQPSVDDVLTEIATAGGGGLRRRPRAPYAHLRVLSLGDADDFAMLTTPAADDDDRIDLVLVGEAGSELPNLDAPVVALIKSGGDLSAGQGADLIVTEDAAVAAAAEERFGADRTLFIDPSIDPAEHNPIGFTRAPLRGVCVFAEHKAEDGRMLADLVGHLTGVTLITETGSLEEAVEQRVAALGDWAAVSREYLAAFVDPRLHRSESAFIEHVLSLGAVGTPVIAQPSSRLDALLPVYTSIDDWTTEGMAATMDSFERERRSVAVRRTVLADHTRVRRFESVLGRLGIPLRSGARVSILFATKRPERMEAAYRNIAAQQYPHLELVTVLHGDGFDRALVDRINAEVGIPVHTIEAPGDWSLGDCLNAAIDAANGELVTKMDDDDTYGGHHIGDLVAAYEFSGADIVGRAPDFVYLQASDQTLMVDTGLAERYGRHVAGPTMLLSREMARTLRFERRSSAVDQSLYDRALAAGCLLYATSPFEFMLFRGGGDHTWKADDEDFIAASIHRWEGFRPDVIQSHTDPR